jgi:hypothetical protein
MADPVTDPVAEHDARYGEEGAGPPEWTGSHAAVDAEAQEPGGRSLFGSLLTTAS